MNLPETVKIEAEEHPKNFRLNEGHHPLLTWLPPVIQQVYQNNVKAARSLDIVLDQLGKAVKTLEYLVIQGKCPSCVE